MSADGSALVVTLPEDGTHAALLGLGLLVLLSAIRTLYVVLR